MGNPRSIYHAVAFAGAVVLAGPAYADTTNCQWIGSTWSCNSTESAPATAGINIDWGAAMRQQAEQARQQREMWANIARQRHEREAEQQQQYTAPTPPAPRNEYAETSVRQAVGAMALAGDCTGAADYATAHGYLAIAAEARDHCKR